MLPHAGERGRHAEEDERRAEEPGLERGEAGELAIEVDGHLPQPLDTETETDHRQARANPGQQRPVGRLAVPLAGQFIAQ